MTLDGILRKVGLVVILFQLPATGRPTEWDVSVCGAGWPDYEFLHQEIMTGARAPRFINFQPDPWRGYANQLFGISSVFAVALLTDRAFLITDPDLRDLFQSPYIDWDGTNPNQNLRAAIAESEAAGCSPTEHLKDCDANHLVVSASEWDLDRMFPHAYSNVSTNLLWWSQLFRNERYAARVRGWGLTHVDAFFGCAMSYLLQPRRHMQHVVDSLRAEISGHFVVGLQLRMNAETAQVRVEDVRHFVACGRRLLAERGIAEGAERVAWVVATDVPELLETLRAELGEGRVVWWEAEQDDGTGRVLGAEVPHAAAPREEEAQRAARRAQHSLKRAVDHWLLSLANATVLSFASTFGLAAAQFHPGRRSHHAIGRHYHQPWVQPACEPRACSDAEPCFGKAFGWFGLCDPDLLYSHGQPFLEATFDRYGLGAKGFCLPGGECYAEEGPVEADGGPR